jgi:hypothetical protein
MVQHNEFTPINDCRIMVWHSGFREVATWRLSSINPIHAGQGSS